MRVVLYGQETQVICGHPTRLVGRRRASLCRRPRVILAAWLSEWGIKRDALVEAGHPTRIGDNHAVQDLSYRARS